MTDNDMFDRISMIMNVDQAEIAKIIHSYIERDIGCGTVYDRLNCPKPPIYIKPVKLMTLRDRIMEEAAKELQNKVDKLILKEDNEMKKATSVQNIKNVNGVSFSIENHPAETTSKLIIVASTNDDIFAFEFEGQDILQSCKAAGLFTGWEKDQKIKELEKDLSEWKKEASECLKLRDKAQKEAYKLKKENENYEEKIKKLEHDDMLDKDAADYWSKEHDILLERFAKLQVENEKLKDKVEQEYKTECKNCLACPSLVDDYLKLAKKNEQLTFEKEMIKKENDKLREELALEKSVNEAQHKFIREYAGKGTEVQFNYAIDDVKEVSYVIVDKKTYDEKPNINLHGKDFTPDELVDRVLELEKKNLDLQKAYDILDKALDESQKIRNKWYEKCIKMQSEQHSHNKDHEEKPADNVNHPSHYTGKYECIDVMQDVFGDEATDNFCLCNAFKYIWRARKKNGLEDVKKAVWYLNKYIEEAEKDGVPKGK